MTEQDRTQAPDISELYRKTTNVEPPPALDVTIKQLAHTPSSQQNKDRRWLAGLAIAATVLLAVGLVRQLVVQTPEILQPIPLEGERVEAPIEATSQPEFADKEEVPAATAAMDSIPSEKPVGLLERKKAETSAKDSGRRSQVQERSMEPPARGRQRAETKAFGGVAGSTATPAKQKRIQPANEIEQQSRRIRRDFTDPPKAPATRSLELKPPPASRSFGIDAVEDAADATPAGASQAPAQEPFAPYRLREPEVGSAMEMDQAEQRLGPEAWLQQIRDLMKAGRLEEARTRLMELKAAYPALALPGDVVQGLSQ